MGLRNTFSFPIILQMSRDRKAKSESCNDDIIPIEGGGIDLSALSNSGFFTGNAFETKQCGNPNVKNPQEGVDRACITFETIALDYVSRLPQRVKVIKGVYGDYDENSLSTDDIYDIHFVRRLKTITVRSMLGHEYQISCNSSIRAATIFGANISPNTQDCALFARVANVVATTPMPKILCTCKTYAGSSPATSVEENEIIAVLSVTFFKGYKYLHVYSFTNRCEKRLPLICNGEFSTHPARTHVPLHELLEHVRDLKMSRVMFFPEANDAETLPQVFFKETFTIIDFSNTKALVGVPYGAQAHCDTLVEFSSFLKAEIVLLPINRDDHRDTTATLVEEYDKRRVHYFRVDMKPESETVAELLECAEGDNTELMLWLKSKCDGLQEMIFRMK